MMVVWLSAAMLCLLLRARGSAFGTDPLEAVPASGGLGAGDLDSVGDAVVLAGLPHDWVAVVLAAVVDGHPDPEGESGLAVADGLAAVVAGLVGGDAIDGVEPDTQGVHHLSVVELGRSRWSVRGTASPAAAQ